MKSLSKMQPMYAGYSSDTTKKLGDRLNRNKKQVKKQKHEKLVVESENNDNTPAKRLCKRIVVGWNNFCDNVTIGWKKLCINFFCTSNEDKNELRKEISQLDNSIKKRNQNCKFSDNIEAFNDAVESDDLVSAAKYGVSAVGNKVRSEFYSFANAT